MHRVKTSTISERHAGHYPVAEKKLISIKAGRSIAMVAVRV